MRALFAVARAKQPSVIFIDEVDSILSQRREGEQEGPSHPSLLTTLCPPSGTATPGEASSALHTPPPLLTASGPCHVAGTIRVKNEILVQMDGAATASASERLLVVGATNRPQELDDAARRRLQKRLMIPLPDAAARTQVRGLP